MCSGEYLVSLPTGCEWSTTRYSLKFSAHSIKPSVKFWMFTIVDGSYTEVMKPSDYWICKRKLENFSLKFLHYTFYSHNFYIPLLHSYLLYNTSKFNKTWCVSTFYDHKFIFIVLKIQITWLQVCLDGILTWLNIWRININAIKCSRIKIYANYKNLFSSKT